MKNIRKLLSLVLSISLLLSACLLNASASSDADGSAIEKLTIEDISIIEGTGGYTDENGKYIYTDISPEVSILDTDGNGYFGKGQIVTKEGTYKLKLSDEQNETSGYWTVGNTYTVTGTLLGRSAEFNVSIIESPVEKIEIDDVSMIENTHGYRKADYHYYYESIFPDVTVTMRDGNKFKTHCGRIWLNTVRYDLEVETGQDTTDGPWTLGNTYKVKGKLLGAECDFNVSIIENPVEKFTVYDIELNESELWSRSYYPGTNKMRYEIKLKDGNVIKSKLSEQGVTIGVDTGIEYDYQQQVVCIDGIYYVPSFDACSFGKAGDDIVGNYTAKASFFSVDTTYTITVTRSKLKSLEIKDYTLIDGVDFRTVQPDFTVVLDDGRRINSYKWGKAKFVNVDGVLLSIYPDSIKDCQPGQTYKVKARVGNITGEFNLTVEENPIKDVELVKGPDKTTYYDGEYFNPVGAVMRINYKDGSHEDINITESSLQLEKAVFEIDRTGVVAKCRSNRMNLETTLYCPTDDYGIGGSFFRMHGGIWLRGVGDRDMVMKLFGYEVTCRITVKENDWDTVTANAGEWAPVLNVTHNDGTETEVRLNDVVLMRGEYIKEGTRLIAGVFTDKGVYDGAVIVNKDGTYSIEIEEKTVNIGKNGWLKGKIAAYSGSLGDLNGDGKINATDALLALQLAVGKSGLDVEKQQLADVDNSGSVTATDALLILQMAVGKIDRF